MSKAPNTNGKKRGPKPKLDDLKRDRVVTYISAGGSRAMAAKFVGVSLDTLAREEKSNKEFADSLAKAESEFYLANLSKLRGAPDWKAAAWLLARKYPEEFAEVKKIAQTDAAGKDLSPKERRRAINAILRERFGDVPRFLQKDEVPEPSEN